MNSIWKIDPKFLTSNIISFDNIYFCSHCCVYTDIFAFKELLKKIECPPYIIINKYESCTDHYSQPAFYTKCYFCNRYIQGIQNGPDIIEFLDLAFNKSNTKSHNKSHNKSQTQTHTQTDTNCIDNILLQLAKVSTWYYHKPYDYFGHDIKKRYNLNSEQIKNIYQNINELYGIPPVENIDEKVNYILDMLK